jgi:hypothetical protein
MANQESGLARRASAREESPLAPVLYPLISIFILSLFIGGCAAPAEPIERKPQVPTAVADLAATQSGNSVILTFTLPKDTVDRHPLKEPPAVEIYRAVRPTLSATPNTPGVDVTPKLVATIPSEMIGHYADGGHFRYLDALAPSDFPPQADAVASYTVRGRSSVKRESEDSNVATLPVFPAFEAIADLKPEITHGGVALSWTPPQKTLTGSAPPIASYHIYRAEIQAATATQTPAAASPVSGTPKPKETLTQIASTVAPTYIDTQAQFDHTYAYSVRSVAQYPNGALESSDSNSVVVTPKDVFPPATPQGLVAVFVPKQGDVPAHLELSWAINAETDIAGYNMYRSEQDGVAGTRVNAELLRTPAFRDTSTIAGRRYSYSVTAVDRAGNESPASDAVPAGIPAESQQQP